jgi:hypothetical protein
MKLVRPMLFFLFCLCVCGSARAQLLLPISAAGQVQAPIDFNGWKNFKVVLTQNVSLFQFTGIPTPAQGDVTVIFAQTGSGIFTVTYGPFNAPSGQVINVSNGCVPTTGIGAVTVCQFVFDGTTNTWIGVTNSSGSTTFNGGTITGATTFNSNVCFGGQNPWLETCLFGMRAPSSTPTGIGNCNGTTTFVFTSGSFASLLNGDGFEAEGCGPASTAATPGTPTVAPSLLSGPDTLNADIVNAPTGGTTTANYCFRARDAAGGFSACSAVATTTTGWPLGAQTTSLTGEALANNTATVTATAADGAAPGAVAFMVGSTDAATFSGFPIVATAPTTSTFTWTGGSDSRVVGQNTAATGGTVQVFNCNHVSIASFPAGAYQLLLYGGTPGSMVPITYARPGESAANDCGSTMSAGQLMQDYVPASDSGGATNDNLQTSIVSGAPTSTVIMANAATQTVSGVTGKFDNAQPFLNAYNAALSTKDTPLRISESASGTSYVFNTHLNLPGTGQKILQAACLTLNETIQMASNDWSGVLGGSCQRRPQFSFFPGQGITVNTAYPGFDVTAPSPIEYVVFFVPAQGLAFMATGGDGFNQTFSRNSCVISGADYMGSCVVLRGVSNDGFSFDLFETNDALPFGYSITPLVLERNDVANANGSGHFNCSFCFWVGRGHGISSNPTIGSGALVELTDSYEQALRSPLIGMGLGNNTQVHVRRAQNDSSITATLANWGNNNPVATLEEVSAASSESGGGGSPGMVTGNLIPGLRITSTTTSLGQNRDLFYCTQRVLDYLPFAPSGLESSDCFMNGVFHSSSGAPWFFDLPSVGAPTVTGPTAGGTLPIATWRFSIAAVDAAGNTGGVGLVSTSTCTTTTGNQTCSMSWTAIPGAFAYTAIGITATNNTAVMNGCVNVTTTSCTATGDSSNLVPSGNAAGSVILTPAEIYAPEFGMTTPSTIGRVTLAGGTKTVTFSPTRAVAPVCLTNDETTAGASKAATTTTTLTITGGATDVVDYTCFGNPN